MSISKRTVKEILEQYLSGKGLSCDSIESITDGVFREEKEAVSSQDAELHYSRCHESLDTMG